MSKTGGGKDLSPVDTMLRGGIVLTMDERRQILSPGSVVIRGNEIVAVGPTSEIDADHARPRQHAYAPPDEFVARVGR